MKKEITKKQWQTPMIILFDTNKIETGNVCVGNEGLVALGVFPAGGKAGSCFNTPSGGQVFYTGPKIHQGAYAVSGNACAFGAVVSASSSSACPANMVS